MNFTRRSSRAALFADDGIELDARCFLHENTVHYLQCNKSRNYLRLNGELTEEKRKESSLKIEVTEFEK